MGRMQENHARRVNAPTKARKGLKTRNDVDLTSATECAIELQTSNAIGGDTQRRQHCGKELTDEKGYPPPSQGMTTPPTQFSLY